MDELFYGLKQGDLIPRLIFALTYKENLLLDRITDYILYSLSPKQLKQLLNCHAWTTFRANESKIAKHAVKTILNKFDQIVK